MYTEIIEQDRGSVYREGLKNYSLRKWRKYGGKDGCEPYFDEVTVTEGYNSHPAVLLMRHFFPCGRIGEQRRIGRAWVQSITSSRAEWSYTSAGLNIRLPISRPI